MKLLKIYLLLPWFFATSLLYAQEGNRDSGFVLGFEFGIAGTMSDTPIIAFDRRKLTEYSGKQFLDSYNYRIKLGFGDGYKIWYSRYHLAYEKDEDSATQPDTSVAVSEKGEITMDAEIIEFPFLFGESDAFLRPYVFFGAGFTKAEYSVEIDGTRYKNALYMKLYNFGGGVQLKLSESFDTSMSYFQWFASNIKGEQFSVNALMLSFSYYIF